MRTVRERLARQPVSYGAMNGYFSGTCVELARAIEGSIVLYFDNIFLTRGLGRSTGLHYRLLESG